MMEPMDLRLLAVALAFAAMGALALVRPAAIGRFFDVRIESVGGRQTSYRASHETWG